MFGVVALSCLYGVYSFVNREMEILENYPLGASNFRQGNIDAEALSFLHETDQRLTAGNNLFYLTSPELGLEVRQNRVMSVHADFTSLEKLESLEYSGRCDNVFLFLPRKFQENGKEAAIQASFLDYESFQLIKETDNFRIFSGQ